MCLPRFRSVFRVRGSPYCEPLAGVYAMEFQERPIHDCPKLPGGRAAPMGTVIWWFADGRSHPASCPLEICTATSLASRMAT